MKNIKTYEGFFDFLKKKEKKESVKFDEVMECLYDLTDEHRIKNELNGDVLKVGFVDVTLDEANGVFVNDDWMYLKW
jgi:hypothetical protein